MPGAVRGTGPADDGEACFVYHFHNYSFDHRAGSSKRRDLSGILLWVVGRKEFFMSGFQEGGLMSTPKKHTQIWCANTSKEEWSRVWGVGGPQESDLTGSWRHNTPGGRGHDPAPNTTLKFHLAALWVFPFYLFNYLFFLRKEEMGEEGENPSYYSAFPSCLMFAKHSCPHLVLNCLK